MNDYQISKYNIVFRDDEQVILYNSFSGTICRISDEIASALELGVFDFDQSLVDTMKKQGILIGNDEDETTQIISDEKKKLLSKRDSVNIVIAPTLYCNLNCNYCFEKKLLNSSTMSITTADYVINWIIKQLSHNPSISKLRITWFGGEPLLAIDIIERISLCLIDYCNKNHIEYSSYLITNGILLSADIQQVMHRCLVKDIQVTIDGTCEHYCKVKNATKHQYTQLMNNLITMADNFSVSIRINYSSQDFQDAIDLLNTLYNMGLLRKIDLYFSPVFDYDNCSKEHFFEAYKYLTEYLLHNYHMITIKTKQALFRKSSGCKFLSIMNHCIDPDGNLYSCEHNVGDKSYSIGNCKNGFEVDLLSIKFYTPYHSSKCLSCKLLPVCMGGCTYDRESDFLSQDYCNMTFHNVRLAVLSKAKRLIE